MYNYKRIQSIIEKAQKEAADEAQKIFDKYQPELEKAIFQELREGDKLTIGNGSAFITNSKSEDIALKMADILAMTQYWGKSEYLSGFSINNIQK